ncbi:MAG TPA: tetratricopeptide repeat protein [Candidatus Binatia bacterium]|jgi:Tfp pilus assembly protein PilF|nr:tetratricopeptide repeat protein [Candidatus Binatia bacterium]
MTAAPFTHLVGASIPRSGHHFLVDLLKVTLGDDLRYCEFYVEDDCCRAVPCTRPAARVVFQKHHDLDLSLAPGLPGILYVIQHRDPVMSTLSDRELLAHVEGDVVATDRDEYVVWLGRRASYYHRFVEKWLRRPRANHLAIEYDAFVADPAATIRRLTAACGLAIADARIERAVADVGGVRAAPPQATVETFTRRTLPASRFLDLDLLPAFESLLLDRLGELRPKQRLDTVEYRDHPVTCVYLAYQSRAAGDLPEALHQLDRALAIEPYNRHLLHERADVLVALDRLPEAIAAATTACALAPDDERGLRRLGDLHVQGANIHLGAARAIAERLVAFRPEEAGHRVHLATVCRAMGDHTAALDQARRAIALDARDPFVWRFASEIFTACRQWDDAIGAVEGAIARAPSTGEFHHHLANVLTLAGRPADAASAHRRAIVLDPAQPGWHWKYVDDLLQAGDAAEARRASTAALARFPGHPLLAAQRAGLSLDNT